MNCPTNFIPVQTFATQWQTPTTTPPNPNGNIITYYVTRGNRLIQISPEQINGLATYVFSPGTTEILTVQVTDSMGVYPDGPNGPSSCQASVTTPPVTGKNDISINYCINCIFFGFIS